LPPPDASCNDNTKTGNAVTRLFVLHKLFNCNHVTL
jgi:hypothetical protein